MSASETDLSPKQVGLMTRWLAKAFKGLSPAEQNEMLLDASLSAGIDIGKAKEEMVISDQWDGPPDDVVPVKRISGGDSGGHAGGNVMVGKPQAASGDGAQAMSNTYSSPTAQTGAQAATERLGKQIAGVKAAAKSMLTALETQNTQIELLKSTVAGLLEAKAVVTAPVVAKAEEEKKEEKKEDREETAKAEDEKETDDEDEKAASRVRVQAKSHLKAARLSLVKAAESEKDDEKKEHEGEAAKSFAKARSLTEAAKALNPLSVIKLPILERAVAEFAKALPKSDAENQDQWPESGGKATAKAEPAPKAEPTQADISKAMEKIDAAVKGFGLLQADMGQFMGMLGGQSRNPSGLPPVFELAKSNPDAFGAKGDEISALVASGAIDTDEGDRAQDVLMQVKAAADGRLDRTIVQSRIDRLSPSARQVFGVAA